MSKRLTYDFVKEYVESLGFKMISDDYHGNSKTIDVLCRCGRKWTTRLYNIKSGQSCFECAQDKKRKKLSFSKEYVYKYIENIGGELLSDYINSSTKILVYCNKCETKWWICFGDIKRGHWCPKCAVEKRSNMLSYDIDTVREYIKNNGGILLSDTYKNSDQKLEILGKCGHTWKQSLHSIKGGSWCPYCAGVAKYTISYVKDVISKMGGKLISKEYKNNKHPIDILCKRCGNEWTSRFSYIVSGNWCPVCSTGKSQRLLYSIVRLIFCRTHVETNYKGFRWLKNKKTGGTQEIDIWVPEIKLAIEYDGRQHFMPVDFGGISQKKARKEFALTRRRDARKNKIIKEHPDDVKYFVRFSYEEPIDKEYVISKLTNLGVPIP